jgi:expansin (peptidoglycan-binding protein)
VTAPRLLSPHRLAAAGAGVLATAVGIALVVQNSDAACAAALRPGKATYFDLEGSLGNCSFPEPPANDLFVAMSPTEYATAAPCGTYLDVTGPKGRVRVKVIDSCPPCTPGHIDLSRTAFRKIGEQEQGIIPVNYRTVASPAVPGPLSVRLKEGSSRYWLSVLIDNHANRLTSVTVNGRRAQREIFNHWTVPSGAGGGPFTVTVTDTYGRRTSLPGLELRPGVTQRTSAPVAVEKAGPRVPRKPAASPSPAKPSPTPAKPSPTPAKPSPSPSLSPSPSSAAPLLESTVVAEPAPTTAAAVDLAAGSAAACS